MSSARTHLVSTGGTSPRYEGPTSHSSWHRPAWQWLLFVRHSTRLSRSVACRTARGAGHLQRRPAPGEAIGPPLT